MRRRILPLNSMTYYIRPDADSIDGNWTTNTGGTTLYAAIDEAIPDDGDYIVSPAAPVNEICTVSLSNPSVVPGATMRVRYRARKSAVGGNMELRVRLLEGTTEIASWTEVVPSTDTDYERALTNAQLVSINDTTNLFLEFRANYISSNFASAALSAAATFLVETNPPNTILSGTSGFSGAYLNVLDYGATGNGSTNDQTAIQNALNAANSQGKGLYFPAGTYLHSDTLNIVGVHVNGVGPTSIIRSTSATGRTSLQLSGTNPKISNVKVSTTWSGSRLGAGWECGIFIDNANGFHVDHVIVDGSPSAGIMNFGGHDGKITNSTVMNTLADAIHNTHKAYNILVDRNYIYNTADDGVAVVSYQGDGGMTHDITATNNCIRSLTHGRHMSVVGGYNVTYDNNYCSDIVGAASLIIATESSYTTYGVSAVLVKNGTYRNGGGPPTGHGIVLISAPDSYSETIDDITIQDCFITNDDGRTAAGIRTEGNKTTNVDLLNYKITGASPNTNFQYGSSVTTNTPWTTGAVGYTPVRCGADNAFHHT